MAIFIDEELCKGCEICIYVCPKGVYKMTDKVNSKGFNVVGAAFPEKCIECRLCEMSCPDLALYIEVSGKKKSKGGESGEA